MASYLLLVCNRYGTLFYCKTSRDEGSGKTGEQNNRYGYIQKHKIIHRFMGKKEKVILMPFIYHR